MNATILLLSMVAQCAGGSCPAPVRSGYNPGTTFVQPGFRVFEPPVIQDARTWHLIKHKGLEFQVWGEARNGMILWDEALPCNQQHFIAARDAARPTALKPETQKPAIEKAPKNFGVAKEHLGQRRGFSGDVREYQAGVESRRGKLFLTVIGAPEDRRKIVEDWKNSPAFAGLRDKVNFGEFNRNEWQVADSLGYHATGTPTILIQQPSGKVEYRAHNYAGGAQAVAQALRKADPNYKPELDPGPDEGVTPGDGIPLPVFGVVGLALLAILLLPRRAK